MSGRAYLSIGDVLSLLREEFPDITISKIRFLESQGLVNPERSPSGYRKFYEPDVERLRWVLRQQREHFLPLKVIRDRLAKAGNGVPEDEPSPPDRKALPGGDDSVAVGPDRSDPGRGGADKHEGMRAPVAARVAATISATRMAAGATNGITAAPGLLQPLTATGESGESRGGPVATDAVPPGPVTGLGTGAISGGRSGSPDDRDSGVGRLARQGAADLRDRDSDTDTDTDTDTDSPGSLPRTVGNDRTGADGEDGSRSTTGDARPTAPARADRGARAPGGDNVPAVPPVVDPAPAHAKPEPPVPLGDHIPAHAASDARPGGSPLPAPPAQDRTSTNPAEVPTGHGDSLTLDELCATVGMAAAQIAALETFGLIEPVMVAGATFYDDDALTVAKLAASVARYGIEPRHLRQFRNAVDREIGLVEQVVSPLLRQRNPAARQRAVDAAEDLARIGELLRSSLLRRELRRQLGR